MITQQFKSSFTFYILILTLPPSSALLTNERVMHSV